MNALGNDIRSTKYLKGTLLLSVVTISYFPSIYMTSNKFLGQGECALKQYTDTGKIILSARKQDNHFGEEMWSDTTVWYQVAIQKLSQES